MGQLSLFDRRQALVGAGARATEELLVAALGAQVDAARADPRLLAAPLRVVVPSRSLRFHVAATLARRLGPALLSVQVQTLHGLAQEIGMQGGRPARLAGPLFDVVALRRARQEGSLRPLVDGFADGQRGVVAAARELLDAGLVQGTLEAARDCIEDAEGLAPGERARAAELLAVAAGIESELEGFGRDTWSSVLRRAAELLATPSAGAAPHARAIFLHGFADATGLAADLVERLARAPGAVPTLDLPPDPADPSQLYEAGRFGAALRERLQPGRGGRPEPGSAPPAAELAVVEAEGDAEEHEIARRIADLLDGGARPEGIGVVAPDLPERAATLRRELGRLCVPFSGVELRAPDGPEARWRDLPDLLQVRERLPVDRWLEFLGSLGGTPASTPLRALLRLAFRANGAARMEQAAALEAAAMLERDGGRAVLPGSLGIDGERVLRPALDADTLHAAVQAARAYVDFVAHLPAAETRANWERLLGRLLELLGVPGVPSVAAPSLAALHDLPDVPLLLDELRLALRSVLEEHGRERGGGKGGGVQVLGPREARGRTFEHLFLLGNVRRGGAPRDPLLTEPVRAALQVVLPDLSQRWRRAEEERFLFAWLLSAAPRVTLSYQSLDRAGRAQSISPLLLRLRWSGRWTEPERAREATQLPLHALAPAADHAVAAGLRGPLEAGLPALRLCEPRGLADARVALIAEFDSVRGQRGPFMGFLGASPDPRLQALSVSHVEDLAACPWQMLLQRLLGLAPLPDPLESVPAVDGQLLGTLVHAILERIVRDSLGGRGARTAQEALYSEHLRVPWPDPARLRSLAAACARQVLEEHGIRLAGLAELLARRVEPLLAAARRADWVAAEDAGLAGPPVLGVEVAGHVEFDGRQLAFRADRVDAAADGGLLLTDYKTGKPKGEAIDPGRRRQQLVDAVRRGSRLQAAAYAAAAGLPSACGRFLHLHADLDDGQRERRLASHDFEAAEALRDTLRTVCAAADAGAFFARVVEARRDLEPARCRSCDVAEACARGDSSQRTRLRRRMDERSAARAAGDDGDGADAAMLGLWWLPEGGLP